MVRALEVDFLRDLDGLRGFVLLAAEGAFAARGRPLGAAKRCRGSKYKPRARESARLVRIAQIPAGMSDSGGFAGLGGFETGAGAGLGTATVVLGRARRSVPASRSLLGAPKVRAAADVIGNTGAEAVGGGAIGSAVRADRRRRSGVRRDEPWNRRWQLEAAREVRRSGAGAGPLTNMKTNVPTHAPRAM